MTAVRCRDDRGSVTIWLALATFVMITLIGLAVDLTGQVHAQQDARDIAAQAARTAGEQLDAPSAIRGQGAQASPAQAVQAAQRYLAAAGVTGTVRLVDGTTVLVTTATTYQTRFLPIIGVDSMHVTGRAEAHLTRTVGGAAR